MAYPCESPSAVKYEALCAYIRVRCRRCENCLKARRHLFMVRAAREQMSASATWFVTLTFGPKRRAAVLMAANAADPRRSQSARLVTASGWFVSTYLKRLRAAGFRFRYLMVPEPHRDGFPHYHGLLHDQSSDLNWDAISSAWSAGFSVVKLVRDVGAIRYVTKYLAKGRFGRLRVSRAYGAVALNSDERSVCDLLRAEDGTSTHEEEELFSLPTKTTKHS